jgi:DNA mismatch repair protein MutS2
VQFIEKSQITLEVAELLALIQVQTPYGKALKKAMKPYHTGQEAVLEASYSLLTLFVDALKSEHKCFHNAREIMKEMKPLDDILSRLRQKAVLSDVDFFELKQLGSIVFRLNQALTQTPIKLPDHLHLKPLNQMERLLDPEGTHLTRFYLYDAYSEALKVYREAHRQAEADLRTYRKRQKDHLEASLQVRFRPNGELTVLKQEKEALRILEHSPHLVYSAENYMSVTFRIKDDTQIDEALIQIEAIKKSIEDEEKRVREELTLKLFSELKAIENSLSIIGELDLWIAKGLLALDFDGVRPEITTDMTVELIEGRHIRVEAMLRKEDRTFTPISITLKSGVTLITGANMGGKTVSLKLLGLVMTLFHYGLYVPATYLRAPLLDFIYLSVGDMQSIDQGLSTFGSEIFELSRVLPKANDRGMILIDELARGTNPEEGNVLTAAILKALNKQRAFTVVTTHFDGVKSQCAMRHYQVKGLKHDTLDQIHETYGLEKIMAILNKQMDYRLVEVGVSNEVPKDALFIAELMGIDTAIIRDARQMIQEQSGKKQRTKEAHLE